MNFKKHGISGTKIEMEVHDDVSIDEVLEEFQNFLRACGYVIEYNKVIALVNMDE